MALHDNEAKARLGYKDKRSRVYADGRERLYGADWAKRKKELWERSGGRCEQMVASSVSELVEQTLCERGGERCRSEAHDPDHVIKRSRQRDDRLSNLKALCRLHHDLKHPEKNKIHWRSHEPSPRPSLQT